MDSLRKPKEDWSGLANLLQRKLSYFVSALLHIEILESNSKLVTKLYRTYTCNVKKCCTYLQFRKEFMIEIDNHTLQQKQGTNIYGFCIMDSIFRFLNKNTYEEQKIEIAY
jgi:hypothetical protein